MFNPIPFIGVVESIDDPEKLGRVQVRVFGQHTSNKGKIPTESLRWFQTVISGQPGVSGLGNSPYYVNGSQVFGYFFDDNQNGIVVGSVPGFSSHAPNPQEGFNDPDGVYPKFVDESDINRLARSELIEETIVQRKKDSVTKSIKDSQDQTWDEPETAYGAEYPHNHVFESNSGHIIEIDDSEGSERINIHHASGTFIEFHPGGEIVVNAGGNHYRIVDGDDHTHVKGSSKTNVKNDYDLLCEEGSFQLKFKNESVLNGPKIDLGEEADLEPSVLGNKLAEWIVNELVPWLNTHNHTGNLGAPTSPPISPFAPGTGAAGGAVYSKKNRNQ